MGARRRTLGLAATAFMVPIVLSVAGCLGPTAAFGRKGTDLSWIEIGLPRSEIDERLGPPVTSDSVESGSVAVYTYDRGFIPPKEREGGAAQAGALVAGAAADFFSLGIASVALTMCVDTCQTGHLQVHYDGAGNLTGVTDLGAAPVGGPGTHSAYCHDAHHAQYEACMQVQYSPRPSTLREDVRRAR